MQTFQAPEKQINVILKINKEEITITVDPK